MPQMHDMLDPRTAKKLTSFRSLHPESPPDSMAAGGAGLPHAALWAVMIVGDLALLLAFAAAIVRRDLPPGPSIVAMILVGAVAPWIISLVLWGLGIYRTTWLGWNADHVIVLDPGMFAPRVVRVRVFDRADLIHRWRGKGTIVLRAGGERATVHLDRPKADRERVERELETISKNAKQEECPQ